MIIDTTTRLTLLSGPEDEPLTLAEAKQFLRIEHNADDEVITRAISAARAAAEEYLRVKLLTQSYNYEFREIAHIVNLPVGPAQSVAQIEAFDADHNGNEVDETRYRLTLDGHGLVFNSIPNGDSFAVEFTVGLVNNAEDIPAPIRQGMLHHIAAMVQGRNGTAALPPQSLHCYQPYRRVRL